MMAELLKRYYPKYVDVKNYIPGCSLSKKIDNWCTLNRKVLSKLDIKLSKDTINSLAQSQPGTIEKILFDIRSKIIKDCNKSRSTLLNCYCDSEKEGKANLCSKLNAIGRNLSSQYANYCRI